MAMRQPFRRSQATLTQVAAGFSGHAGRRASSSDRPGPANKPTTATVRNVLSDFHERGIACVHKERPREGALPRGRPRIEKRQPGITAALERLLADDVAGDPMTEKRWVRVTLTRLSERLREQGYFAVEKTVRRLLPMVERLTYLSKLPARLLRPPQRHDN